MTELVIVLISAVTSALLLLNAYEMTPHCGPDVNFTLRFSLREPNSLLRSER